MRALFCILEIRENQKCKCFLLKRKHRKEKIGLKYSVYSIFIDFTGFGDFCWKGLLLNKHNLTVKQPFVTNEGTFSHNQNTRKRKMQVFFTKKEA